MAKRRGVSLVEVVIAMLVFAVGGLGLAASAAAIAKQIAASGLRSDAAMIARSRAEAARSSICGSVVGGESATPGLRTVWSTDGSTLEQRVERSDPFGAHSDRFMSALPCR